MLFGSIITLVTVPLIFISPVLLVIVRDLFDEFGSPV